MNVKQLMKRISLMTRRTSLLAKINIIYLINLPNSGSIFVLIKSFRNKMDCGVAGETVVTLQPP